MMPPPSVPPPSQPALVRHTLAPPESAPARARQPEPPGTGGLRTRPTVRQARCGRRLVPSSFVLTLQPTGAAAAGDAGTTEPSAEVWATTRGKQIGA
jgi:hypothetical protein